MTYNFTISGSFFEQKKKRIFWLLEAIGFNKKSRKAPNLPEIGRSGADFVKQLLRPIDRKSVV